MVAPYAGAWIEIQIEKAKNNLNQVAPYAGAWIEIASLGGYVKFLSRTLRGCVD